MRCVDVHDCSCYHISKYQHTHVNYIFTQFLIIATDGVWEFVSSSEAIAIVDKCFQQGMGASEACEELIKIAMSKWKEKEGDYRDDVSAIVVKLNGIWDHYKL
jgi:Serine/threonine protein phosphatase